jgi:hypothetical protein
MEPTKEQNGGGVPSVEDGEQSGPIGDGQAEYVQWGMLNFVIGGLLSMIWPVSETVK